METINKNTNYRKTKEKERINKKKGTVKMQKSEKG